MQAVQTLQQRLAQPDVVAEVKRWQRQERSRGRSALARHLCGSFDLHDHRSVPRVAGVQKALRILESQGLWKLPVRQGEGPRSWQPRRLGTPVALPRGVPARAERIKGLALIELSSANDERFRIWNELMLREHPLRDCRLVGRQLRYLIGSDHGWLGALGFGSCALRLAVRDQWIGWDEPARGAFQERLIGMTRFLIRPPVHCANLASQVLSLCMRRVAQDYRTRYGVEPWLVESFVDGSRYTGRCYQAANWIPIGVTTGRGRSGPGKPTTTRKLLYLYELNRRWRADMGLPSAHQSVAPLNVEHGLGEEAWVAAEFGGVKFGHEVSERRLLRIAVAKARNPSASYPECVAGDRHQLKAYYRFIGSRRETVDPAGILAGHRRRTIARMKGQSRVLMIQDSTDLDFSSRLRCNGLGVVGKNQTGAVSQGLKMHSSLAVSDTGLPLGVLQLHLYAPKAGEPEKRAGRPIETKESFRWLRGVQDLREISAWVPQTELIAVGDRESDLFELFDYRRRQARNIHLLVRANHNRCLQQGSAKLFEHLGSMPAMAQARIQVPRQRATKGKPTKPARIALPARIARVTLRWSAVTLAAPDYGRLRRVRPVELYALLVREPHPPKGAKSLHWVLLTTIPIRSRKQALRTLRWYTLRWRIEEWHRVLKSGCRIESHQHHSAERLARAIAIDAVIGWRLMLLTLLARETPHAPATLVFPKWECRLLELLQPLVAPRRSGGRKRGLSKSQQPV